MRALNPTVSMTAVTETLTWDNAMELVRGNNRVLDTSDNPRTRYLINSACVLAEMDPKTASTTKGIIGRGVGPILLVSVSAMGTKGKLTVYNHWGRRGGATNA